MEKEKPLLEIKNLTVSFRTGKGIVHAVRGVNLNLHKGETLALVGESGSGKSVTAKAVMGLEAANSIIESGEIWYKGKNILSFSEKEFNRLRGNEITMVFQDPLSALDPIVKIGPQITEATILNGRTNQKLAGKTIKGLLSENKAHFSATKFSQLKKLVRHTEKLYTAYYKSLDPKKIEILDAISLSEGAPDFFEKIKNLLAPDFSFPEECEGLKEKLINQIKRKSFKITKKIAYYKALDIMEEVGIKDAAQRFKQYPFEFSGGMRQRIVIAIAIAANPELLICDEPTTALDVTIQAQILELINRLKEKRQMSVLFITHDLGVVANIADRVAVMYAGKIVENGNTDDIFYHPAHPYTWALLSSMPDLDTEDALEAIPGTPPNLLEVPKGDAFAPRNKYAMQIDFEEEPPLFTISESHSAATWLLHPDAPKVELPQALQERIIRMKERAKERNNA